MRWVFALLSLWPLGLRAECLGTVHFQDRVYEVEIVADNASRARGLMFRTTMNADAGMLFIYEQDSEHHFWMKNTVLPLDILFYQSDGALRTAVRGARPFDLTPLPGYGSVILELNAGQYDAHEAALKTMFDYEIKPGVNNCPELVFKHPLFRGIEAQKAS